MKLIIADIRTLSEGDAMRALACFPVERRAEILRCKDPQDRMRSIAAETALRLEVMERLHLKNNEISVMREGQGKPYLENCPAFFFNLSHAGELAVCATDESEVGVDVEKVRPVRGDRIAGRFFSKKEREEVAASPLAFFRIWTEKESILKMRGKGLKELSSLSGSNPPLFIKSYALTSDMGTLYEVFSLKKLPEDTAYVLSVCSAQKRPFRAVFASAETLIGRFCGQAGN